ncbi:MAG: branched-chain amino acid transport system ATP-binding protein [Thermoleophilaceae bacterium]|jgi:branched-chain amino acid transport system ATP-binding protein|nr:branched-chain amino acid transport system ATP-binding protein [Thermoleophilaceae bacterium]MEA2400695.1 branched-chain amino acid transport system ATP-binding protein [Thermoleophilaceae bacterium]
MSGPLLSRLFPRLGSREPVDRDADLRVEALTTGYGAADVLHGIDLHVNAGEAVALLGANGAGKTTFLRTISGLHKSRSGKITFGSHDLTSADPPHVLQRGIAHVPQGRQVFASQSVRENLLLGARLRRDAEAVARDLDYSLEVFPALRDKLKQPAGDLSGGQQQQLAIARGLMSDPALVLLDEPSQGLAPRLVEEMGDLLRKICHDRRMGMLLVEQDAFLALELTGRAYVLQRGEIILERPSETLTDDPSVVFAYLGGELPPTQSSGPGAKR